MFRTWADVMAEGAPMLRGGARMAMAQDVTASEPAPLRRATSIDRGRGEGPPRCCGVDVVAADELVWYGGLPAEVLARVRACLPRLAGIPDEDLYLCGSCRNRLRNKRVLQRSEMPLSRPLALPHVR